MSFDICQPNELCGGGAKTIKNPVNYAFKSLKPRKTFTSTEYPNVEVDISKDNWAIEVKYNAKFYDGVGQLLTQKVLYNVEDLNLIHVHKYLNPKFINGFLALAKKLNINGVLIFTFWLF